MIFIAAKEQSPRQPTIPHADRRYLDSYVDTEKRFRHFRQEAGRMDALPVEVTGFDDIDIPQRHMRERAEDKVHIDLSEAETLIKKKRLKALQIALTYRTHHIFISWDSIHLVRRQLFEGFAKRYIQEGGNVRAKYKEVERRHTALYETPDSKGELPALQGDEGFSKYLHARELRILEKAARKEEAQERRRQLVPPQILAHLSGRAVSAQPVTRSTETQ